MQNKGWSFFTTWISLNCALLWHTYALPSTRKGNCNFWFRKGDMTSGMRSWIQGKAEVSLRSTNLLGSEKLGWWSCWPETIDTVPFLIFCLATSFNLSWKDLYTEDGIFIGHWEFSPNWGSSLFSSTSSSLPQPVKMWKRIHWKMLIDLTKLYFFSYWKKINQEWISRDFSLQFLLIRESKYPKTIPI